MRTILILAVMGMFSMAGCSNKAIYDNVRINKRNECLKRPPSEHKECMEGLDKTYEEYERERKEIVDE